MKTVLTCLILLVTFAGASSVVNTNTAADMVFSEILNDNITGKSVMVLDAVLPAGSIVETWHEEVTVPMDAYLVLIDDMAYANWEHPCRWVFVGLNGDMEIVRMMTPPNALERMTVEYTSISGNLIGSAETQRELLLENFKPNPMLSSPPENCYAWLISGGANQGNNHARYYFDIQYLYLTLTQDYAYLEENIIVCFADGTNPAPDNSNGQNSNPDLDGDGDDDFNYDATYAGILNGYNDIDAMVGLDDYLIIMTTDHGGSGKYYDNPLVPPEVYLNLWNSQTLDDDAFDTWIDELNVANINVIMEQCYSGGFLEEVITTSSGQDRVFSSACNAFESSYGGAIYDPWIYWWTCAMHGETHEGASLEYDPDLDGDSFVNYWEAFDAAYNWDPYAPGQGGTYLEHPQYDDSPDSCGELYYLGGLIIPTGIGDSESPILPSTGGLTITGNPVSAVSAVVFNLGSPGPVEILVYDMSGHVVENLLSDEFAAGQHSVNWSTDGLAAGMYIVRFTAGDIIQSVRAVKF